MKDLLLCAFTEMNSSYVIQFNLGIGVLSSKFEMFKNKFSKP
jgi:hypothetical protein